MSLIVPDLVPDLVRVFFLSEKLLESSKLIVKVYYTKPNDVIPFVKVNGHTSCSGRVTYFHKDLLLI